jgi:hypothetical protein
MSHSFSWLFYTHRFTVGYRDAQCGWITAWEEVGQLSTSTCLEEEVSIPRTVSFLVIYISKRGIVEVWTPQQGTRVAAFNYSKGAKYNI